MIAAICFAMLAFAAIGAVAYFGLPKWVPFATSSFAEAPADLVLDFPPNRQERRTLPDNTDFFNVSGTITNIGKQSRNVPNLRVVLRDSHGKIVRKYEIASPRPQLTPGESEAIDQAFTDAPKSARRAYIGWKGQ
jgi:hypothetical protein